jgi:hypothetical protein
MYNDAIEKKTVTIPGGITVETYTELDPRLQAFKAFNKKLWSTESDSPFQGNGGLKNLAIVQEIDRSTMIDPDYMREYFDEKLENPNHGEIIPYGNFFKSNFSNSFYDSVMGSIETNSDLTAMCIDTVQNEIADILKKSSFFVSNKGVTPGATQWSVAILEKIKKLVFFKQADIDVDEVAMFKDAGIKPEEILPEIFTYHDLVSGNAGPRELGEQTNKLNAIQDEYMHNIVDWAVKAFHEVMYTPADISFFKWRSIHNS